MVREQALVNYAQALLASGVDPLAAEEALVALVELFQKNQKLKAFFESPRVKVSVKKKTIKEALVNQVPKQVVNFLLVLIDRRREAQLAEIVEALREENDKKLSRLPVMVYLSKDFSTEVYEENSSLGRQIREAIEKNQEAFGLPPEGKLNIRPKVKVVPELLGGVIIRVGDYLWDGSVRRYLKDWARRLTESHASVKKMWQ